MLEEDDKKVSKVSVLTSPAYYPVVFRIYYLSPSSYNNVILAVARALGINPAYIHANERNIDQLLG